MSRGVKTKTTWTIAAVIAAAVIGTAATDRLDDIDVAQVFTAAAPAEPSRDDQAPNGFASDGPSQPHTESSSMLMLDVSSANAQLDALPVKGRAPKTGYSREQFGQAWSDDVTVAGGHNGCDTRNDVLAATLSNVVFKNGTKRCVVLTGTLSDQYTGSIIDFVRGQQTSTAVQIDHVVALSDAWQKGAQQLSVDERRNFANDPRNLLPVDGPTNAAKSDGDAATWLPPDRRYWCEYVSRQIDVKVAYRLWITSAEKEAMQRVLASCVTS